MPFQLSPGVLVVEKDLTNIIPAVASSIGGFVGNFAWGPAQQPVTISSELELVKTFGRPNSNTFRSFFSAANFLSYSGNLLVVRQIGSETTNATAFAAKTFDGSSSVSSLNDTISITAHGFVTGTPVRYSDGGGTAPGSLVDGTLYYIISEDADTIKLATTLANANAGTEIDIASGGTGSAHTLTPEITVKNEDEWEAQYADGSGRVGSFIAKFPGELGNSILVSMADVDTFSSWDYEEEFDDAPGTSEFVDALGGADDEVHVIVIDEDGLISGTPGTILEKFANLSKAIDAKGPQGGSNYYPNVLRGSQYIHWMDHPTSLGSGTAWGSSSAGTTFKTLTAPLTVSLSGGVSETDLTSGEVQLGYDLFNDAENIDVNLIFMGHHSLSDSKYVIENIAQTRMDCVVFCSPSYDSVVNNAGGEADAIIAERVDSSFNVNSSYGVMDSGWKYQYDKYNDVYRWIPLNADIAGLCARTDLTNDPWWSPGGLTRGQIKNVVKLAYKPDKADRDNLYKKGINPVVSFPGEGTVLFGDKTLLAKPSAFDRINVRRLFIVLEKAIATASKYQLFEFNDAFTRAQFRNLVEPFLRDVQGRRGIYDFRVVCDESNNTGEVIDRNEFIADIYVKPARSINFITLNFIATRTGIAFEEVVGA